MKVAQADIRVIRRTNAAAVVLGKDGIAAGVLPFVKAAQAAADILLQARARMAIAARVKIAAALQDILVTLHRHV
jgi:hypothetical protein